MGLTGPASQAGENMRILVTGAKSPLGVAVCEAARADRIDLVESVRGSRGCSETSSGNDVIRLDLNDPESFCAIPTGLDAIVHVAAANEGSPEYLMRVNGFGTRHLVETAERLGIRKFVHISSMSVYGPVQETIVDAETPVRHGTPYGLSKWAAECYLNNASSSVIGVSVRSPAIVGKEARRNFLAVLRNEMERKAPFVEVKNPDFLFNNIVHTDAFAAFIVSLLGDPFDAFRAFPIASSNPLPVREIVLQLAIASGYKGEIKWTVGSTAPFAIDSAHAVRLGYKPWTVADTLDKWLANPHDDF